MPEVESIEKLHRAAQARLGLAVALYVQDGWAAVQAAKPDTGAARWTASAAEAVMYARELSGALARAYYRLARAVETGYTLGERNEQVTIGNLRSSFSEQALSIADIGSDSEASPFHALYTPDIAKGKLDSIDISDEINEFLDESTSSDGKAIRVDPYAWPPVASGDEILERLKRSLTAEAIDPLKKEIAKISKQPRIDQKRALAKIDEAYQNKGKLGAGKADEYVMRAGRAVVDHASRNDRRVLKYARGTAANPCHFCAMLASRGFVYVSAMSATKGSGLKSYHPHCHCFPIARWTEQSPLPALNTRFEDLWNREIRGKFSGDSALRQWRRVIARERAAGSIPSTPTT